MDQAYMKKESVLKLLITMALPMVISMLVNSLYNIVDSFFVAQISEDAMTAISLVFPMQNFINSVMIGFGIGINSVISFYMGAQDKAQADKAASQGILLATIHGIVMTAGCIMLIKPFLCMFTNDSSIVELGLQYSYIAFAFSTILAWQLVFEKTFQAVGRMTASMTAMLGGCITNIVLDPMLIFGIGIFPALWNKRSGNCHRNRTDSKPSCVCYHIYTTTYASSFYKKMYEARENIMSENVFGRHTSQS